MTSVPLEQGGLQGAKPLISLDILRTTAGEREKYKPEKIPVKCRPSMRSSVPYQ